MSNKNAKMIRGQVRQVVQEVLTEELVHAVYKKVSEEMAARLSDMADHAKISLQKLDENQKDMQNHLTRVLGQLTPVKPAELAPSEE